MDAAAKYVLSLCCGALICGILLRITGSDGPGGTLRRLICGMFLVLLAISPLKKLDFRELDRDFAFFSEAAESAALDGKKQAGNALDEDISERCRTYILDKAGELSVSLEAEVEVDSDTHFPVSAVLTGTVTPGQKQILTECIARNLGIERSRQEWKHPR